MIFCLFILFILVFVVGWCQWSWWLWSNCSCCYYGVSGNVCPSLNFMDVFHTSTFISQEKSMKKMVPSISSFDQENMHFPLPYLVDLPWILMIIFGTSCLTKSFQNIKREVGCYLCSFIVLDYECKHIFWPCF